MQPYILSADIGGTTVKLGLFSSHADLLDKWEIPTRTENAGTRILPDVAASITQRITCRGITPQEVAGLGMGVPGPVDADSNVCKCINLGWGIFNLKQTMGELLPRIPTIAAGNDATVATLGEVWAGGAKGFSDAVMLTLGTGVGSGVVCGGKIVSGANGAAGEMGHFTVEPEEPIPCTCGKYGCLEQYASANGLVSLAKRMLAECCLASPLRDRDSFSSKDICDLARQGDEMSERIVDRCAEYLGRALSYAACVMDPQVFILGGGMSRAGDVLFEPVRRHYRKYAFHPSVNTPIVPALLGNDAGIYGCAKMILDLSNS